MPRYKLLIEYDGTDYAGWQSQHGHRTVQDTLTVALQKFCGEVVRPAGAGRTDAGVHARGQIAHVDLARNWRTDVVRDALNAHLYRARERIVILAAQLVPDCFDARFSALARHYRYRILPRRAPAALERNRIWQISRRLDVDAMREGARHLVGLHDFTTFRASACQAKSPVKTLDRLDLLTVDGEIVIEASARSFLHNQVRSMVGSLVEVGNGNWQPDDVAQALAARDRTRCGPVAPACGLYLMQVDYPADDSAK